jgi:hypothetical protein
MYQEVGDHPEGEFLEAGFRGSGSERRRRRTPAEAYGMKAVMMTATKPA